MARRAVAGGVRDQIAGLAAEVSAVDRALYRAIAQVPTPVLDQRMRQLSRAANHSVLWLSIAAGLAAAGGSSGRRAAAQGVTAVGVTSAVVNIGIKSLYNRPRPDRDQVGVPAARQVSMPASRSFPSGHSASGFAFAAAVGTELPWLAPPLRVLAAAVAYSRVHTGVHYPGDALAGSVAGASLGRAVTALVRRRSRRRSGHPPWR